jgi:uncharacterized protein YycO
MSYISTPINFGDMLTSERLGYQHTATYIGNGNVVTNTPTRGEHICSLQEFADGREVRAVPVSQALRDAVYWNQRAILSDPRPYNLFNNNCEHTVHKLYGLPPRSPQVIALMSFAGMILFGMMLARAAR